MSRPYHSFISPSDPPTLHHHLTNTFITLSQHEGLLFDPASFVGAVETSLKACKGKYREPCLSVCLPA